MGRTLLSAARHEAAHAVIAMRFGAKVRWARVLRAPEKGVRGDTYMTGLRKMGPVQLSCIVAAGSVAEHLWHGTSKGMIGEGDYEDMVKGGLRGEDFRIIWEETSRLLRQLKPKVWKLAEKLRRNPGKRVKP